jgi:hypothetical protein
MHSTTATAVDVFIELKGERARVLHALAGKRQADVALYTSTRLADMKNCSV